jgi:hypothetical protein
MDIGHRQQRVHSSERTILKTGQGIFMKKFISSAHKKTPQKLMNEVIKMFANSDMDLQYLFKVEENTHFVWIYMGFFYLQILCLGLPDFNFFSQREVVYFKAALMSKKDGDEPKLN